MSSTGASGVVRLRIICGPTGAGKSALALRLAEAAPVAILSADARQVYCGFDVGTAKPTAEERRRVPHFGLDLVEPAARFSAAEWAARVPRWVADVQAVGRDAVVVGGTGFYVRALVEPLFDAPSVDPARRSALAEHLASLDTAELRRWCRSLDPTRADLGRTQLQRAVETAVLTGSRITDLYRTRARAPSHAARYLLIDPGRSLDAELVMRVDRMLAAGWLDEVRALSERVPPDAPAWTATGYDTLREVVEGKRSLDDARETIVMRTRQYAKRQRTWFRHQVPPDSTLRLDPLAADAFDRALAWWHQGDDGAGRSAGANEEEA